MPVSNALFGVWKVLGWYDTTLGINLYFIVEDAKIGTQQDIKPEQFVQGTALPVILSIGGAKATMSITAPLLVQSGTARSYDDLIHDGLRMWCEVFNDNTINSMFSPIFSQETGLIITEASLDIDNQRGAKYTFTFEGDADYLGEETGAGVASNGFHLANGLVGLGLDSHYWPIPAATPLRVAAFYDFVANVGSLSGFLEKLKISYKFSTRGFNYIGQKTQRQIVGMSGGEVSFQGTMIHNTRQPLGYQFPWQAMNSGNDLPDEAETRKTPSAESDNYGGVASYSGMQLDIYLRGGLSNNAYLRVMPRVGVEKTVFQSSEVQISADLIRTSFNGFGWIDNPTIVTT